MARPQLLNGRTEILAAIYNPDHLPSAVLCLKDPTKNADPAPYCLHSMREEDLSYFEIMLKRAKEFQNLEAKDETDEEVKAWVYPFFTDYPKQNHTCNGCHYSDKIDSSHSVGDSEIACTKSTDACA